MNDDYREDAPIVILASFWLLALNLVAREEWLRMTYRERCEKMEASGFQWDGKLWRKEAK